MALIKDYEGTEYGIDALRSLYNQIYPNLDTSRLVGGVFSEKAPSVGFNYDVASQFFGRSPTVQEQVVLDMARQLAKANVLDIGSLKTGMYTPPEMELESGSRQDPAFSAIYAGDTLLGSPVGPNSNSFGATYTGEGGTAYNVGFNPATNKYQFYTSPIETSDKKAITALAAILGTAALGGAFGGEGLFGGGSSAYGSGAWLGEGIASGIPEWNAAYGGALLADGAGLGAAAGAAGGASTLGTIASSLLKNPSTISSLLNLAGGAASNVLGGNNMAAGGIPTQGIPENTPQYYAQLQNFLNQYVPGQMPTQAQYLANWYGSQPGMLSTITEGSPVVSGTATTLPTTTIVLPTTTATTIPTTTASASSPLTAQQAADYYRSTVGRGLMSERDLVNELRAIGVPDSIMTQAQGLLSGGNAAPVYDKTYTATDIREAIQQTLKADPNVRKEDLKILAATTYGVDPFEFDRQWIEVAGNKFIDKYANTTDPIIRELVNNMRETQQIYENSSNAVAVNAAQNAAIAADLANPNFNATPADIAEAYRQSVGARTMTETDFVNRALAMGATPSDLKAAQNILLGR